MALACAEKFAVNDKHVLVLLTDMTAFADSIKEIKRLDMFTEIQPLKPGQVLN